ncbi:MAG: SMC-Scp complex subunit ScpB [Nanoarchaeota archaeon]|nr:SMC-Scp complex subunit ScpB [Nanoarchaeota archaeon]
MLKSKLEALLFSSGRKMSVEELSRLSNAQTGDIKNSLTELKKEYDEKSSSVMLVNEGDCWKLTVREQFLPLVQKIITETELSKTVIETLAVIAFKYPIKQSDLIKIRTNKSYDHLKELEELGYISRQKHGRTNLIKLTQKFFEYFDLPERNLREKFKDFASIAKTIEDKEKEIEAIKQEQKASAEKEKQKDEEINKEVDLMDEKGNEVALKPYGNKEVKEEITEGKLGTLDIVKKPSEEKLEEERERIKKIKEEDKIKSEEKEKPKFEGPGIVLSKEEEKLVDEKVERILHPEKEGQKKEKETQEPENKTEEEPKDLIEASMEENKKEEKQ